MKKTYKFSGEYGESYHTVDDVDDNLTEQEIRQKGLVFAALVKYNDGELIDRKVIEDLAESIRSKDQWDPEELRKLCKYAGIENEWDKADGESFEAVAEKAAEILGVEI